VTATRSLAQRRAIAYARERRESELAPLRVQVARAVAEVGWTRARPVVAEVMAPVPVHGPHGRWGRRIGKRNGRRLLAALSALPVQGRLGLVTTSEQDHDRRSRP
jgi:hypothetical protein